MKRFINLLMNKVAIILKNIYLSLSIIYNIPNIPT